MALVRLDGAKGKTHHRRVNGASSTERYNAIPVIQGPLFDFGQSIFLENYERRGPRRDAPVIGSTGPYTQQQQIDALRNLLQYNVHGVANTLYNELQNNPVQLKANIQAQGADYDTIVSDIMAGNAKSPAASISGPKRLGATSIPTWQQLPTSLTGYTFNSQFVGNTPVAGGQYSMAVADQNTLLDYIASYNFGQDVHGYYGTNETGAPGATPGDFNATSDAEVRGWYASFAADGVLLPNGQPLPAPIAQGGATNTSYASAQAANSKTVVQVVAAAAGPVLNSFVPGAGTALNSLVGNTPSGTSSAPASTPLPPPPPVLKTTTTFFTPTVLAVGAAAVVGIGLFIAFND